MLEVFKKDCKVKVIEYGADENISEYWDSIKNTVSKCIERITF